MPGDQMKKSLVRASSLMSLWTLLSRILGLVREIVRAHFLGTSIMADAFGMAFMIPNLFRRLAGEGAMSVAAVPIFGDELKKGGRERLGEAMSSFFTLFTFLLTLLSIIYILAADVLVEFVFARGFAQNPEKLALTVELSRYMFFYLLFIGLAAVLQAVLNTLKIFGPSAFTPVLLNLIIITCAIALGRTFSLPVYAFAIGVMIGGAVQLFFQLPYVYRAGIRLVPSFRWRDPAVKNILRLMAPGLVGAGIYQINVVISQMIASYLDDGAIASLEYSHRLTELVLGVFVVAIGTAVLPSLADLFREGRMDRFRETLEFALRLVAFITIPASVGLIVLRYPIISMLFKSGRFDQHSVELTSFAFLFHAMGILFIGAVRVLEKAFFAKKEMVAPVKAAAVSATVNIVACLLLFGPLKNGGIALANSLSVFAQTFVMGYFLVLSVGRLDWRSLVISLLKIAIATAIMGALAYFLVDYFGLDESRSRMELIPAVFGVIAVCSVAYALICRLLKSPEIMELWSMLSRRIGSEDR